MNLDFKNKRVLVRVDFNVPLDGNQNIMDNTRIVKALPTIAEIIEKGGRPILMTHLGRPQKKRLKDGSLNVTRFTTRSIMHDLARLARKEVIFSSDCIGAEALQKSRELKEDQILLLENTRFHKEEGVGDHVFASQLAKLADFYVNDAFGSAHRAHASTTVVAKHFKADEKCFGLLMESEIKNADKILQSPKRPLTAIIGGAKVSDKIELIHTLIEKSENIIIGGGMAFTFIKAQGGDIGKSLVELEYLDLALDLLDRAKANNVDIHLPVDSIIADDFSNSANTKMVKSDEIPADWMGLDIGDQAKKDFAEVIKNSQTVLWNGPLGVFEMSSFSEGTFHIAQALAEATEKGTYSLVGGGDSVSAINKAGLTDKISFVSTGGGAMLEYLQGKRLPGIQAMLAKDAD